MSKQILTGFLTLFILSADVFGATTTSMGTFAAFDHKYDGYYFDAGDPPDGSGNLTSGITGISGLAKFDPALGTLNKITVNANFDYSITSLIEVLDVLDDELPTHSASFTANSNGGNGDRSYVYVGYQKGSSRFFITEEFFKPAIACSGSANLCTNTETSAAISFDSPLDILNTPPKSTQIASGLIDLDDFVGAGPITSLVMAILMPQGSNWDTDNVREAYGEIEVKLTAGTVSIEYDYTPTVVPVPAAIWLFISAACLLGVQRFKPKAQA